MNMERFSRALEGVDELLAIQGDNPEFFAFWREVKAQAEQRAADGNLWSAASLIRERMRAKFVSCGEWAEVYEPNMDGPWAAMAARYARLMDRIDEAG